MGLSVAVHDAKKIVVNDYAEAQFSTVRIYAGAKGNIQFAETTLFTVTAPNHKELAQEAAIVLRKFYGLDAVEENKEEAQS